MTAIYKSESDNIKPSNNTEVQGFIENISEDLLDIDNGLTDEVGPFTKEDGAIHEQKDSKSHLIGHEATVAARRILGDVEQDEIQDRLQSKSSKDRRRYNFQNKYVREPAEIAYTYDMIIDQPEIELKRPELETRLWYNRDTLYGGRRDKLHVDYNYLSVKAPLTVQPDEPVRKVNLLIEPLPYKLSGRYEDIERYVEDMATAIEQSLPPSFQIIGFQNGMEMLNPYQLRDWLVRIKRATPNSPLPIKIITQPKKQAMDYRYLDEALLSLKDKRDPRADTEQDIDPESGDKFFDTERYEYLRELKSEWGETPPMVRFRFNPDDPQDYVALKLPRPDGKYWVIAENYEHGNAMFLLDPNKLEEGETWEQVLKKTTKKTAKAHPSVSWIQHRDGWKDRVLDIITA